MVNITDECERVGIFFLYDPHGVADNSVLYFLKEVRPYFKRLLVVVNGLLTADSKKSVSEIVDEVLIRENEGYDAWAYKAAIEHLTWEQIEKYDELTLFNFTNFGPLYPFSEMFEAMDAKDVDFWGITKHHAHDSYKWVIEHIQSHWISFRRNMFTSKVFKDYWKNLPEINSYYESISKHEVFLTNFFATKGFKWDVYVNTDSLSEYAKYPLLHMPLEMIKTYRCPIIKKKCFSFDYAQVLSYNTGEEVSAAFEYIKNNLNYNVDYIWETILRLYNYSDIKNNLHLNHILSSNVLLPETVSTEAQGKVALIVHIYFTDLIEYCFSYAKSIPETADVYITTDSLEKKQLIAETFKLLKCNKLEIRVIENRGRDVGALLVGCKDVMSKYDLICFAHDKKSTQIKPLSLGKSFSYRCWENTLKSSVFVENVIKTFKSNRRLGLLFAPPPYHGPLRLDKWSNNFNKVKTLAQSLGINVPIDRNKQPIAPFGTIFWFRPAALKTLIEYDWNYRDFPQEPNKIDGTIIHAIERLYSYGAQQEGYYSAWVTSEDFARLEIENLSWLYTSSRDSLGVKGNLKLLLNSVAIYLSYKSPLVLKILSPLYILTKKLYKLLFDKKPIRG